MKKILILILICFAQNTFSQSTKKNSKTKNSEIPTVKVNNSTYSNSHLTIDEPQPSQAVINDDNNAIYNTAGIEVKPEFPGGQEALERFLKDNFKKMQKDLKGKVYATFIIEKDGSLSDIKILRDIGYGTGEEAIRVLKKSPKWTPGKQNNKVVRVLYSIPIVIN